MVIITDMHTYTQTDRQQTDLCDIHAHIHMYMHACANVYIHTCVQTHTNTHTYSSSFSIDNFSASILYPLRQLAQFFIRKGNRRLRLQ